MSPVSVLSPRNCSMITGQQLRHLIYRRTPVHANEGLRIDGRSPPVRQQRKRVVCDIFERQQALNLVFCSCFLEHSKNSQDAACAMRSLLSELETRKEMDAFRLANSFFYYCSAKGTHKWSSNWCLLANDQTSSPLLIIFQSMRFFCRAVPLRQAMYGLMLCSVSAFSRLSHLTNEFPEISLDTVIESLKKVCWRSFFLEAHTRIIHLKFPHKTLFSL